MEPVKAYKIALLNVSTYELLALMSGSIYGTAETRFKCLCFDVQHEQISMHNACGWYAYKCVNDALAHVAVMRAFNVVTVMLEVELWGKIIEYEYGYRAEHQRVMKLWLPGNFKYKNKGILYNNLGCEIAQFKRTHNSLTSLIWLPAWLAVVIYGCINNNGIILLVAIIIAYALLLIWHVKIRGLHWGAI